MSQPPASDTPKAAPSAIAQVRSMTANFWVANIIEAGERLAFFGVRAVLPLYMVGTGGAELGLNYTQKGIIYMVWALLQTLIPMVSGGYTDAYGYRKSMFLAFAINIAGYITMANASGFWTMMLAGVMVGTGTAIFKPPVQGAVAKSLNKENSGLGFGIFYWIVNIGGFAAPMAAAALRGDVSHPTWNHLFYGAAVVTAFNYLPAIFLFKEPEISAEAKAVKPLQIFRETLGVLWRDQSMLRFLLIISGFWFMFMQLWDLLPNFIDEWVDTRDVGAVLVSVFGDLANSFIVSEGVAKGAAKPEILINIDSFAIILLVLPISWFFGKFKMMYALVLGMAIGLLGFVGAGVSMVGGVVAVLIFVFAIGEMICSPKFSEFIGMTAPPDKKALYMGYSNIPFAIGWAGGNGISGPLYDAFASKDILGRRYLVDQLGLSQSSVDALKPDQVIPTLIEKLGPGADAYSATATLWQHYNPWIIWVMLGAVGLASLIGMLWFYLKSPKSAAASQ